MMFGCVLHGRYSEIASRTAEHTRSTEPFPLLVQLSITGKLFTSVPRGYVSGFRGFVCEGKS
jgi:hypothetical protein